MGHVELPESEISGPVGLAGAPRPRTASNRPRSQEFDRLRQGQTVQRDRSARPGPRRRPGRYLPLVIGFDLFGLGIPAWLVLRTDGQPRALAGAAAAAMVWSGVRAARGRYAVRSTGRPPGALTATGDWLLLVGLMAVLWTVADGTIDPATAVVALIPGLLTTAAISGARRLPWSGRRRTVRRVLVVGEAAGVDRAVRLLVSRADHGYLVVAAVPVGTAALNCEAPVPGRLAPEPADDDASTVLGAAFAHEADLALVVPGPQLAEERLRRLSWGLHDGGLDLSVLSHLSEIADSRVRPRRRPG